MDSRGLSGLLPPRVDLPGLRAVRVRCLRGIADPIVAGQPDEVRLVLTLGGRRQIAGALHRLVWGHDLDPTDHRRPIHEAREEVGAEGSAGSKVTVKLVLTWLLPGGGLTRTAELTPNSRNAAVEIGHGSWSGRPHGGGEPGFQVRALEAVRLARVQRSDEPAGEALVQLQGVRSCLRTMTVWKALGFGARVKTMASPGCTRK